MPRAADRRITAARLAAAAEASGWTPWQLSSAIARECAVSLLQAARLSRGWSLRQAVDELAQLGQRVTVQQLSAWERGTTRPSIERLDALCRLHQTRPDRLGYGTDYTPVDSQVAPESTPNVSAEAPMDEVQAEMPSARHAILRGLLSQVGLSLSTPVLSALMSARQDGAAVFTASVSDTTVDQWESTAADYGHAYQHTPPARLLGDAVLDFLDVRQLLSRRQSADHRARLCHVAARLAATAGIALVAMGEHREARAWYRVAQLAAEETHDRALRAWLVAREAVIPFYYGAPAGAAELAERARVIAGTTVCATAAWAPALKARALARLGRPEEARAAMVLAERAFVRLGAEHTADLAYGYTERQLRWHMGSMYTTLGDIRRAQQSLDQALNLYAPTQYLDRALIALDQADGLMRIGEIGAGAQTSMVAVATLPNEHRTGIVLARAREVAAAVPPRSARLPLVVDLREMLALPS
ncbi:helix-turn-helix domain-containing protein [Kitasatospora sp. NPDC058444]|uniref:helix-turn-helix domain-containing protein n=1 Tax=Kitasatospora sp. NPDC058444 TaxID=3346504 RepID=UPI00364D5476